MGAASKIADPIPEGRGGADAYPPGEAAPELKASQPKPSGNGGSAWVIACPLMASGLAIRVAMKSGSWSGTRNGDLCSYERGLGGIPLFLDEVGIGEARRVLGPGMATGNKRARESPSSNPAGE